MAAVAELDDLNVVVESADGFENEYPEAYARMCNLLKNNRKVGFRNICKLFLRETTPEKLKGLE